MIVASCSLNVYFGVERMSPMLSREIGATTFRYGLRRTWKLPPKFGSLGSTEGPFSLMAAYGTVRSTYDDSVADWLTSDCSGLDGKPITRLRRCSSRGTSAYDLRGNVIERDFFGVDGKPTLGRRAMPRLRFQYDDEGNLVEATSLGIDGKPVLAAPASPAFRQAFDGRHNRIGISYYGADGEQAPKHRGTCSVDLRV